MTGGAPLARDLGRDTDDQLQLLKEIMEVGNLGAVVCQIL